MSICLQDGRGRLGARLSWLEDRRQVGHLGISCWVSYIDGVASLRLLRQHSKARMVSIELGTKDMASILESSLRSPVERKDRVRLLLSGWSARNQHDLEVEGFSLCKKSFLHASQEGNFCFKICCNKT